MFLPDSEVETGVLRQGDIVSSIHAFGAVNLGAVNYIVNQEDEKVNELIQSNFVSGGSNYSYLKYFYVDSHDKLQYPSGAVVDFSKLFSVRKQSVNLLVANKVAQLNEHAVFEMSLKLALYFHRTQPAE